MNTKPCLMVLLLGAVLCAYACSGPELTSGALLDGDDAVDDDDAADDDDTADDDDGADPMLESTHWRVVNVTRVEDHWNISELTFYTDSECTSSLSEAVTSILSVSATNCDQGDPDLLNDGVCTFGGHCGPGNWANEPEDSGSGQAWVGYELSEASSVGCITLCQGSDESQRVTELTLEQSNDGGDSWVVIDTIVTKTDETDVPTLFVVQ